MGLIRDLAEGREATLRGKPVKIPWVQNGDLEAWMEAYRPNALELAGSKADGLILQLADPFVVSWATDVAQESVRAAGRRTEDFNGLRACSGLCGRRPRPPARPGALVRWHGRQPRSRHRGALRARIEPRSSCSYRLRQGPKKL